MQTEKRIYHAYPIYLAAKFSRGSAILLVHEEEEITLFGLDREIIVHCVQIRHLENDFRPSSREFLESKFLISLLLFQLLNFEYFQYEYHEVRVLDLPILREVGLVLVWTVHTLFEYAQFPLLENQFVSSIHKYFFGKIRWVFMSQDLGFCFWEQLIPYLSNNDPDPDSCLTLGYICAFCDIQ